MSRPGLMFYGRGAGGQPTASAVLGDVIAAARNRVAGGLGPGESIYADLPVLPLDRAMTRYYVNLDVADRPGVLATIAQAFADNGVSIQLVRRNGHGDDAGIGVAHAQSDRRRAGAYDRHPEQHGRCQAGRRSDENGG